MGIRVNCVSPGTTVKDENRNFYKQNLSLRELYAGITPLRRMGTAEDVAAVVAFLCSKQAGFITGQNIIVDGGASLQWPESMARGLAALDTLPVTRRSPGNRR
jgi:NAD(P)-dependent dehydrogenase (short-subunit alcohol dehydrogenase family)